MDTTVTAKDRKVLAYVCDNFSCKICNNILIQCVTLTCGHNFCHYCLDLYISGKAPCQCPQCCSSSAQHALPNPQIDQKIDNLLSTCSEEIQEAYGSAMDIRFRKTMERAKLRQELNQKPNVDAKACSLLEEITQKLKSSDATLDSEQSVAKALKSAQKTTSSTQKKGFQTSRKVFPPVQASGRSRGSKSAREAKSTSQAHGALNHNIDMDKVNILFGIYDNVLKGDNEPYKDMAGGDFSRADEASKELETTTTTTTTPEPNLKGIQNFTRRSQLELEGLIQEAEDILKLDDHIQRWTKKMKEALSTNIEASPDVPLTFGMCEDKFDRKLHAVNDKLWKASTELLERLQGVRSKGSVFLMTPTIPPPPRSAKLDLGAMCDEMDSDAEEYEKALENLESGMESVEIIDETNKDGNLEEERVNEVKEKGACEKEQLENAGDRRPPSRKKSILDCVEESGNDYVKENIEFITQMRKYKEALIKIQNREVTTAEEIRELVPKGSFRLSDAPSTSEPLRARGNLAMTPRCNNFSNLATIMNPSSRPGYSGLRPPPFSLSTRLPPHVQPSPLSSNRPTSAIPFDLQCQSQALQAQKSNQRQLTHQQPQNGGTKLGSGSGSRRKCKNPLYTVR